MPSAYGQPVQGYAMPTGAQIGVQAAIDPMALYYQQYAQYQQQCAQYYSQVQQQQQQSYAAGSGGQQTTAGTVPVASNTSFVPGNNQLSNYPPAASSFGNKKKTQANHQATSSADYYEDIDDPTVDKSGGGGGGGGQALPIFGNEKTMNLNHLLLTNIQSSPYFRNTLYPKKTVNELMNEIKFNVKHMEPWERGSRKVSLMSMTLSNCINRDRSAARRGCVALSGESGLGASFQRLFVSCINCLLCGQIGKQSMT